MLYPARPRPGLSAITLFVVLAAFSSSGCTAPAEPEVPDFTSEKRHTSYRRARVVVADEVSGKLSVLDLEHNEWIATIEMDGPRKLVASESGDFATLVSSSKGLVGFLRGGVAVSPHDDHLHIHKFEPSLHDFVLAGAGPNTAASNARKIGIFFEEMGDASVVLEKELVPRGDLPIPTTFATGEKHKGIAIPMATGVVLTNPKMLDQATGRARFVEFANDAERIDIAVDCPSIEGSVGLGKHAALACADGVLVVSEMDGNASGKKWAYPGPERAQTLQGHAPSGFIAGNLGSKAIFRMDVNTGETKRIDTEAEVCGYALEPAKAESIVVLTTDGSLLVFNIETGTSTTLSGAVAPFACDAIQNKSQLALTPDRIFVTVPGAGEVLEIGFDPLTIRQRHTVGGAPSNIVVLGLDAANIDIEPGTH